MTRVFTRTSREPLGSRLVLFFRVVLALTRGEIALRRHPLPLACHRLGIALAPAPEVSSGVLGDPASARSVRRAMRAVAIVTPRWPWGDTCLRRCLALGQLLRDLDPVLSIGVRRQEDQQLGAHSWILIGGHSLDPTSDDYGPLTVG